MRLRLNVLGPLRIWRDDIEVDAGPRQQRCLLALLLVRAGRPVSFSDLTDLLWGADPPPSADNVIYKYVGALRRLLEPDLPRRSGGSYLLRDRTGYRFAADPSMLDLLMFRQLVGAARAAEDRPGQALDRYLEALRLWPGATGEALAGTSAAAATFAAVDSEFHDAAIAAAEIAVRVRRPAEILPPLRMAAETGRLHEPVHARLLTALDAAGHQAESLAGFRTIRDRLAEELGIDPGRELNEAHQRVLDQAPAVIDSPLVWPAQLPPDQPMFVGRRAEIGVLRDLAAETPIIAVHGMAGAGKSALVTHFAHQVAGEFPDGQLYVDLRSTDAADTTAGMFRGLTAGKRILVVLDNVRDPAQVPPLVPSSPHSLVLVTSRGPLIGLAASHGARLFRAGLPGRAEAGELFRTRLPMPGTDVDIVDEIVELCGRLPLALAVLAARISARPHLSLRSVAAELRDDARRLEAFPNGRGVTGPRVAFAGSYRHLTPGAARLFRLLSVAYPAGISAPAAAGLSGRDLASTRAELAELADEALLTEEYDGRFTSHVLVRAYAAELFRATESPAEQQAAATRLGQQRILRTAS